MLTGLSGTSMHKYVDHEQKSDRKSVNSHKPGHKLRIPSSYLEGNSLTVPCGFSLTLQAIFYFFLNAKHSEAKKKILANIWFEEKVHLNQG